MTENQTRKIIVWVGDEPVEYLIRIDHYRVYATVLNSPKYCDPEIVGEELCLFEFKHSSVPFATSVVKTMLESFFQGPGVRE